MVSLSQYKNISAPNVSEIILLVLYKVETYNLIIIINMILNKPLNILMCRGYYI